MAELCNAMCKSGTMCKNKAKNNGVCGVHKNSAAMVVRDMNPMDIASCQCPVCYENKETNTQLKCGHSMCDTCSDMWFEEKNKTTCPLCRTTVKEESMYTRWFPDGLENADKYNLLMALLFVSEFAMNDRGIKRANKHYVHLMKNILNDASNIRSQIAADGFD